MRLRNSQGELPARRWRDCQLGKGENETDSMDDSRDGGPDYCMRARTIGAAVDPVRRVRHQLPHRQ